MCDLEVAEGGCGVSANKRLDKLVEGGGREIERKEKEKGSWNGELTDESSEET